MLALKAISFSLASQALSSGTTFVLSMYLLSVMSPEGFGLYNLAFAAILFLAGIGNALFLTQMVVLTPRKKVDEQKEYARRILSLLVISCFFCSVIGGALGFFAFLLEFKVWGFLTGAIAIATAGYVLKDFYIRYAYINEREIWVFLINFSNAIFLALFFTVLALLNFSCGVSEVLVVFAASQFCAAYLGKFLTEITPLWKIKKIKEDFKEAWAGGKWDSLTNCVYFLRTQSHTLVVGALIGSAAVAKVNAARIFVSPVTILIPGLSQVFLPRLSKISAQGTLVQVEKLTIKLCILLALLSLAYAALLFFVYEALMSLFSLKESYQGIGWLVVFWMVYVFFMAINSGLFLAVKALNRFKYQAAVNSVSAAASVIFSFCFCSFYMEAGAVLGIVFAEVVALSALLYMFRKSDLKSK
ncbi:lipopolysaccharide biosynthesis protein [Zoogloea sp.]|uniref:lipopolysaccharide biosynthesis protein n=1 Tax=Zoogloea sp. TaxID=49181 RepID=UPI0035B44BC7